MIDPLQGGPPGPYDALIGYVLLGLVAVPTVVLWGVELWRWLRDVLVRR